MPKRKDLTNQKFGRLTVIGPAPSTREPSGASVANWYVKCDCGNTLTVRSKSLTSGNTKSCGCLKNEANRRSKNHRVNEYVFHDNYVEGKTSRGGSFYVDIEDYEKIKDICWHISTKEGYLGGFTLGPNRESILLHRLIMDAPSDMKVDHINHDPSDNRKCNLRIVTHQQNMINTKLNRANKSGYKGVWRDERYGKWLAYISYMGEMISLGYYDRKEDAIAARQAAEEKYFGAYSYDNSIEAVPRIGEQMPSAPGATPTPALMPTVTEAAPKLTLPVLAALHKKRSAAEPSALV